MRNYVSFGNFFSKKKVILIFNKKIMTKLVNATQAYIFRKKHCLNDNKTKGRIFINNLAEI